VEFTSKKKRKTIHGINIFILFLKHHTNALRTTLLTSLADWYNRANDNDQQQRLSRVLEVVQDLKTLPTLLGAQPMTFILDLACLASRRGYLKLDKWLSDKLREHQVITKKRFYY
jgi:CCR4-NOT transcription complex subunit 1